MKKYFLFPKKSNLFKNKTLYSISCGLSATPEPGQSTGARLKTDTNSKEPANTGLIKALISTLLYRH
jgi:hypothetical protein